jgi:putative lipoic acid-binding regulatory protein
MDKQQFPGDLYNFPNSFVLRVIGKNSNEFESFVVAIVQQFVPELSPDKINSRLSRDGNYLAVTIEVIPHSKEQLDSIYKELSRHDRVLMVL